MPTIAFVAGTSTRNRASRALRLRSPRDTPLRLPMNVLLLRWDTKPNKRIRRTFLRPATTRTNVFLCREARDYPPERDHVKHQRRPRQASPGVRQRPGAILYEIFPTRSRAAQARPGWVRWEGGRGGVSARK